MVFQMFERAKLGFEASTHENVHHTYTKGRNDEVLRCYSLHYSHLIRAKKKCSQKCLQKLKIVPGRS